MTYVDGFVVPVKEANKQAYIDMATKSLPIFKEHGALHLMECWGNDLPRGTNTDFFMAVKAEEGENVVFSWIVWPSKEVRDAGWAKVMTDGRMEAPAENPFDGKRMFWGGFETMVDSKG